MLLATDRESKEICTFDGKSGIMQTFRVENTRAAGALDGVAELSHSNIAVSYYDKKCITVYTPNEKFVSNKVSMHETNLVDLVDLLTKKDYYL